MRLLIDQDVYQVTTAWLRGEGHDVVTARELGMQRATVSITANIAEGFDANSDDEFVRFLRYALRSATEVQSHLYVAVDQGYISGEDFTQLYDQATEVKSLIAGFIRYLKA